MAMSATVKDSMFKHLTSLTGISSFRVNEINDISGCVNFVVRHLSDEYREEQL